MRSPEPSGRMTPIRNAAPSCLVNAIRSPRGLQTGVPLSPGAEADAVLVRAVRIHHIDLLTAAAVGFKRDLLAIRRK